MSFLECESFSATLEVALTMLNYGWVSIDQLRHANKWRLAQRPRLGELAQNVAKLTQSQVESVLAEQKRHGKLFGETAVELGFMNFDEVSELLRVQEEFTPCLMNALLELKIISSEQAAKVAKMLHDTEVPFESTETNYEAVLN